MPETPSRWTLLAGGALVALLDSTGGAAADPPTATPLPPPPPAATPAPAGETRAWLTAELEREPGNGIVLYTLARFAARAGDPDEALRRLGQLAASGWDGGLERADFAALAGRAELAELAARLERQEKRVARARLERELTIEGLGPEGTAWDARRGELLLSSGLRRTVVAVDAAGRVRDVARAGLDGVFAVLGLEVEAARDRVWAATSAAPFMAGYRAADDGRASLVAFDLATGELAVRVEAPRRPALLNDLVVAADGTVFVTDSLNDSLWRLAPGGGALEPVATGAPWVGPNGVALGADGRTLYVADFRGVARFDPATGAVERLAPPAGVGSLGGIDGLERSGGSLVGIQNVAGRGRIWRLDLDAAGRSIVAATLLESGNPLFFNPTTGALAGGDLLFVANPAVQLPMGDATSAPGGAPLRLLRLPVAAPAP